MYAPDEWGVWFDDRHPITPTYEWVWDGGPGSLTEASANILAAFCRERWTSLAAVDFAAVERYALDTLLPDPNWIDPVLRLGVRAAGIARRSGSPLTAATVDAAAADLWPGYEHVVDCYPDIFAAALVHGHTLLAKVSS